MPPMCLPTYLEYSISRAVSRAVTLVAVCWLGRCACDPERRFADGVPVRPQGARRIEGLGKVR